MRLIPTGRRSLQWKEATKCLKNNVKIPQTNVANGPAGVGHIQKVLVEPLDIFPQRVILNPLVSGRVIAPGRLGGNMIYKEKISHKPEGGPYYPYLPGGTHGCGGTIAAGPKQI